MAAASLYRQRSQAKILKPENDQEIFELTNGDDNRWNSIRITGGLIDQDETERKPYLFDPHKEKSG